MNRPTPTRPSRQSRTAGAVLLLAGLLAVSTTGCGVADRVRHVKTETYSTRGDAPTSGDLAFRLPDLVPSDATDVTVTVRTQADGRMYSWTSVSGRLPTDCEPGDAADARPFAPETWPSSVYDASPTTCGSLPVHIRRDGQEFHAWW